MLPRWAVCLIVAVILWLAAALIPLPYPLGTILYAGAVIAAVLFLVFLILDLLVRPRRGPGPHV